MVAMRGVTYVQHGVLDALGFDQTVGREVVDEGGVTGTGASPCHCAGTPASSTAADESDAVDQAQCNGDLGVKSTKCLMPQSQSSKTSYHSRLVVW